MLQSCTRANCAKYKIIKRIIRFQTLKPFPTAHTGLTYAFVGIHSPTTNEYTNPSDGVYKNSFLELCQHDTNGVSHVKKILHAQKPISQRPLRRTNMCTYIGTACCTQCTAQHTVPFPRVIDFPTS